MGLSPDQWAAQNGFTGKRIGDRWNYVANSADTKMPEMNEIGDYQLPGVDYKNQGNGYSGYSWDDGMTEGGGSAAGYHGGSGYGAKFTAYEAPAPPSTPGPAAPTPPAPTPGGGPAPQIPPPSQEPLTILSRPRSETPSGMGSERDPEIETSLTDRVLPASGRALQQLAAQRGGRIY